MSSIVHLEFPGTSPEKLLNDFLASHSVHGLESLSEVVTPINLVLLTASRDVDLKNYAFLRTKNLFNESFWEKGVHLSYTFQFKSDCKENRFCGYIGTKYDANHVDTTYGELSERNTPCS